MFYYRDQMKKSDSYRSRELIKANKIIQESIDRSMQDVLEELRKSEIPIEKHDEILKNVRRDVQVEAIKLFKEKLKSNTKLEKP
jgi:hypothetical protein